LDPFKNVPEPHKFWRRFLTAEIEVFYDRVKKERFWSAGKARNSPLLIVERFSEDELSWLITRLEKVEYFSIAIKIWVDG